VLDGARKHGRSGFPSAIRVPDRQERFAAMTNRVVGGQIMMQDDLERLHKNMLEQIADE